MKNVSVRDLMEESGVAFGTSGARGLVSAMTDRVCYGYTEGFLRYLRSKGCWDAGRKVALAGDLRPSTPRIIAACCEAVRDLGGEPVYCGLVPTPALAHYAMANAIPAIMVTGSHIPDDRNGIKFYRPEGEILKDDEPGILAQVVTDRAWDETGALPGPRALPSILDIRPGYVSRYVDFFGCEAIKGSRIGVYQHSAVGRDIVAEILYAMGADVVPLGRSETFIPVDTEAVRPEDAALARQWAAEHQLDAIVSTDGDSDRPLLADENGEWLRGDVLAMLCARQLGMQTVVTPVSSNSVVERSGFFSRVERTRIGSPYVIATMQTALNAGQKNVCGYEANGGFLLGSDVHNARSILTALPTRDAMLPIIAILVAALGSTVRALVNVLPERVTYSDLIPGFAPGRRDALMAWMLEDGGRDGRLGATFGPLAKGALKSVDLTDGVRMRFVNEHVIHLRGSGNAPELRCYSEAATPEVAKALCKGALAIVAEQF